MYANCLCDWQTRAHRINTLNEHGSNRLNTLIRERTSVESIGRTVETKFSLKFIGSTRIYVQNAHVRLEIWVYSKKLTIDFGSDDIFRVVAIKINTTARQPTTIHPWFVCVGVLPLLFRQPTILVHIRLALLQLTISWVPLVN